MGLNETTSGERIHIGFFGVRNAGKSSVVNAVTGQELCVVSDVLGTTTDPVSKSMELLPLGPVVIIDTPGIDDDGALGEQRVKKTKEILRRVDIAVFVVDVVLGMTQADYDLMEIFKEKQIPYVIAANKWDLIPADTDPEEFMKALLPEAQENDAEIVLVSALKDINIEELKEVIGTRIRQEEYKRKLAADLVKPGDLVVLVVPIDASAPKGRLILPQQQAIRDLLEAGVSVVVCRETEFVQTLEGLSRKPALVITDSQVFGEISKELPEDIPLTSFSILMMRYKGNLEESIDGARQLDALEDGDCILISEACTHHRKCGDIGTQKLPIWIRKYTGKDLEFEFTSGHEFPEDLSKYKLVVHCGGCMINGREMKSRICLCQEAGVPITNYGVAIAQMNGILERSLRPFS